MTTVNEKTPDRFGKANLTMSEPSTPLSAAPEDSRKNDSDRGTFSLGQRLRHPRTLISFGLAIAIIVFAVRSLDINLLETWQYMRSANPWLLGTGLIVFYLTFPLRALRWRMLLINAGVPVEDGRRSWASFPALIEYIYLSWFANCIVPAKLGDAYRGYLLKQNGNVSFSATFGTIFAERLLDMIGLFSLLVLSGFLTFGPQMPEGTQIVFGFGSLLVIIIISGLIGMRWLGPQIRWFIPRRLHRVYGNFEHSALTSFAPAILPRLFVLTAAIWTLEGFRLWFVIQSLDHTGLNLTLAAIIFVALSSSLLTALPITPAGLGVVEGTITVVLTLFGIAASLGSAVTLLDRLINFWSIVIFGFILYLFSRRK